jgi:hypothetical protein
MLSRVEANGGIMGLPITMAGICLNHLFFVDNSMLFCRASLDEWVRIKSILEIYEKAFGQKINREKTSIFFSKYMKTAIRDQILSIVGVNSTQSYEKYIGIPTIIDRSKTCSFKSIQGRIG